MPRRHDGPIFVVLIICAPIIYAGWMLFHLGRICVSVVVMGIEKAIYQNVIRLQDWLANRRRRRSQTKAVQLPDELLEHTLDLLRRRAHFGRSGILGDHASTYWRTTMVPLAYKDLHSASLVCHRWHRSAIRTLYVDIDIRASRAGSFQTMFTRFARALHAKPERGLLVRRLALRTGYLSHTAAPDFLRTVAHILDACPNATQFGVLSTSLDSTIAATAKTIGQHFERHAPTMPAQAALEIYGPTARTQQPSLLTIPASCLDRIVNLSLQDIEVEGLPFLLGGLVNLRRLRMEFCYFSNEWLSQLIEKAPQLDEIVMHLRTLSGTPFPSLPAGLIGCHDRLTTCALAQTSAAHPLGRVILGDLSIFTSLRTLMVDIPLLSTAQSFPPSLQTLILLGSPRINNDVVREVASIRSAALLFQTHAPRLAEIDWWSFLNLKMWKMSQMMCFLLSDYLRRRGMVLTANFRIGPSDERFYRQKFARQRVMNRLLWRGVG